MTASSDNSGIWIGGQAQVTAGAMAAGQGAHAEGHAQSMSVTVPATIEELRAALGSLVADLRAGPPGVSDPGSLAEIATSAHHEVTKDRPNKAVLRGLLHALMAGVTNSAALATAVVAIQHAVSVLL